MTLVGKLEPRVQQTGNFFFNGWAVGSLCIGAGKLYAVLTKSELPTQKWIGHCGTSAFRRQLAMGAAGFILGGDAAAQITERVFKCYNSKKVVASAIISGLGVGLVAAKYTPHSAYTVLKMVFLAYYVFRGQTLSNNDT